MRTQKARVLVFIGTAIVFLCAASLVRADSDLQTVLSDQHNAGPVETFIRYIRFAYTACQLRMQTELVRQQASVMLGQAHLNSEPWDIIRRDKEDAVSLYQAAKQKLSKKPDALGALKELYVYWRASMELLAPSAEEREPTYKLRTDERWAGIVERQNKLEIEL